MMFTRPFFKAAASRSWALVAAVLLVVGSVVPTSSVHAQASPEDDAVAPAMITSLPKLDRAIHDAMQSRSYGDAIQLIETELGKADVTAPDYLRYLQGVAHSEAEKYDAAIEAFQKLENDYPESPWVSRARFGRAHAYVLKRQYICLLYTSPSPRDLSTSRMPSSA